jgi:hypothetical protein
MVVVPFMIESDCSNYPILHRALSTVSANQTLANNQRNVLAKNYRRTSVNDEIVTIDHNDADASFILPNLYELPEEIRVRVMDSLVDSPTMLSLEETSTCRWKDAADFQRVILNCRTIELVDKQAFAMSQTVSTLDQWWWQLLTACNISRYASLIELLE